MSERSGEAGVSGREPVREFLRHVVATVAYRGGKTLRGAPAAFATLAVGPTSRTPLAILAHLNDLLDWALTQVEGEQRWRDSQPQAWASEVERFHAALAALDAALAGPAPLGAPAERIFQGPLADALTHVGQLAMLRRLADSPVRGENYFRAEIAAGRVGAEQAAPRREFD
jgi:hypothetical protein